MLRLHGVPLPGFAIGTLGAIILLITAPLNQLSGDMIGLTSVGVWLVCDAIAATIVSRDRSQTADENRGASTAE